VLRPLRAVVLLAAVVSSIACQTLADPFLPTASLALEITNTSVGTQRAPLPAPQITVWNISEMSVHALTDYNGTYAFLQAPPCTYQLNALAPLPLNRACALSGLSLEPGTPSTAVMRISISGLELRAAARPNIATGADPDGDGIPNGTDNCPIVFNPGQENGNKDTELVPVGDACSDLNTADPPAPTVADQDVDGVRDGIDNCLWYPNPLVGEETIPTDANRDGIGDACERIAPVVLPAGQLTVECGVSFVPVASKISIFRLDFGRSGVLTCDAGFTGCILDVSAMKLELFGTDELFDCHQVP
jgi:hypothetical protein